MIVDEFIMGVNQSAATVVNQSVAIVDEKLWSAIAVIPTPPPPEPKFPWLLFGIAGVAIVGIRTKKILDKERRS